MSLGAVLSSIDGMARVHSLFARAGNFFGVGLLAPSQQGSRE
jgi:hypothetical protein